MKRTSLVAAFALSFATVGCSEMPSMPAWMPGSGWTTLVDADKGLDNWDRIGDANWRAEEGAIVADKGKGGYLVSKSSYKDFETVSIQNGKYASGPFALQYGAGVKGAQGGPIKWRKVQIKPL